MTPKDSSRSQSDLHQLKETKIDSRKVFDGRLLQVYVDDVRLPDGNRSTRDWIDHPGASAVVPVFEDGTIMLLKQFRYPAGRLFLEVPAGKLDPGEEPHVTARREMEEESGLQCEHLVRVGSFFPAIGYANEEIHVFVAWGLTLQEKSSDEDEFLINSRISFKDALQCIENDELKDGKTICALTMARRWWLKNEPFPVDL
ncbi:MAG: NUDIX domain-containing protein [Balneolaceae bacterium]